MTTKIYNKLPPEARAIREEVFIHEQGFSYDFDAIDDTALHPVIFEGNTPVGVCRIFQHEQDGVYVLGRLAVKKEYRGRGIGSALVEEVKHHIKNIGGKTLILHSQLQAKEFYSRLGFSEYGEIEFEEDCPHVWMKISFHR